MDWIYLSKNNDEYVERLARGMRATVTDIDEFDYDVDPQSGLVLRGIMKHKLIKRCWQNGRRFRYMDTGYFGNRPHPRYNRRGWKVWHRLIDNDLQQRSLVQCPGDRWQYLDIDRQPWRSGRSIVIVAPDEKPCAAYGIKLNDWIQDIETQLVKHTDRPIVLRHRRRDIIKQNRSNDDSFARAIADAHAVITFNSNAAVECVISGVPVFITHDVSAAGPVANRDLANIENPWLADQDLVMAWLHGLAYSQFHNHELEDGSAMRILDTKQNWPIIEEYK